MPAILERIAPMIGAKVIFEPRYKIVGLIRFRNGRKSYFWDNKFNLNSVSAVRLAQDKGYSGYFLESFGYKVPKTMVFFTDRFAKHIQSKANLHKACEFAKGLKWPVFVKPCRRSQGEGVYLVSSQQEFIRVVRHQQKRERTLLVQEACMGRDYRIVVLDGKVISAYERVPLTVIGDGVHSIRRLLKALQERFRVTVRDTIIPLKDERITMRLRRDGRAWTSIPKKGEIVRMLDVANLSLGGTTIDITRKLHPSFRKLAAKVAADMDLRFAGIDIIAEDATKMLRDYHILEINSAPGLDHYGRSGAAHEKHIDMLYLQVLKAVAKRPK